MELQSILSEYKYDINTETMLQKAKDSWAVSSKLEIEKIEKTRQLILERFFSKLQRHEQILYSMIDTCKNAQKKLELSGRRSDSDAYGNFCDNHEIAFNVEKARFNEVFIYELNMASLQNNTFNKFLTDSKWDTLGNSNDLRNRNKQLGLLKFMMTCFSDWYKLFLSHQFYDAGFHRKYISYTDDDN
jgi:hypothetical protein